MTEGIAARTLDAGGAESDQGLARLFNLRQDQAEAADIDAGVRSGARASGTNLWVLFFAMLIASVGLNVNSPAAIIGAMLISPLMGPIIGIGYGAGIIDSVLIRSAARTLAVFAALSLVTSTLYFTLSPLVDPGTELLARTSPTIWDVLIAFFGGAAGMIALSRRSPSNVLPGVAIATALMPPLCTAGFGIAHARWDMVGGALYLFVINSVFIAAATLFITRVLRLPARESVSAQARRRTRIAIAAGLLLVLLPSIVLGARMVDDELFKRSVRRVVGALKADGRFTVIGFESDPRARALQLTVLGERDDQALKLTVRALMDRERLAGTRLELRHPSEPRTAADAMARPDEGQALVQLMGQQLKEREERIRQLEAQMALWPDSLAGEVQAQLPAVRSVLVTRDRPVTGKAATVVVLLEAARPVPGNDLARLQRWLAVRLATDEVVVLQRAPVKAR